ICRVPRSISSLGGPPSMDGGEEFRERRPSTEMVIPGMLSPRAAMHGKRRRAPKRRMVGDDQ
ncbi:hypothetical protein Dimus_017608, partial [Dionaea muscipula]